VICYFVLKFFGDFNFLRLSTVPDMGDMQYFEIDLEFRIFILESVIAVWRRNDDFFNAVFDKSFDVFPRQPLNNVSLPLCARFTADISLAPKIP